MTSKTTGTVLYGASDDLIEFEGDYRGEVGFYKPSDDEIKHALVVFSDGTLARIGYGKAAMTIWEISVMRKGDLFDRIETCEDEDAKRHSDQLFLKPGVKWAYVAIVWQRAE